MRTVGAEGGVVAVARVDDGVVGVAVEEFGGDVGEEGVEIGGVVRFSYSTWNHSARRPGALGNDGFVDASGGSESNATTSTPRPASMAAQYPRPAPISHTPRPPATPSIHASVPGDGTAYAYVS